jgi:hypothetical protein
MINITQTYRTRQRNLRQTTDSLRQLNAIEQISRINRQFWCVPNGEGNSKIAATVAVIAFITD